MKQPKKIRILLADDLALVREGLKTIVSRHQAMEVVAEAADGRTALNIARQLEPNVALLDASMPNFSSVAATREIHSHCSKTRVVALLAQEDKTSLRELVEAGVAGCVLKRSGPDDVVHAIREVAAGGQYLDPNLAVKLVGTLVGSDIPRPGQNSHLSERETEVLKLIAWGYTNKEIAAKLMISVKSVETYKTRAMEKLSFRSRPEIVRHALRQGWLEY